MRLTAPPSHGSQREANGGDAEQVRSRSLVVCMSGRSCSARDVFAPMPSATQQLQASFKQKKRERGRLAERILVSAPFTHREPRGAGMRYLPGGAGTARLSRTGRSGCAPPVRTGPTKMGALKQRGISFFAKRKLLLPERVEAHDFAGGIGRHCAGNMSCKINRKPHRFSKCLHHCKLNELALSQSTQVPG